MITDFIFDEQELSGFGYIIVDFNSSSELDISTVSDMSFTDVKSPLSNVSHNVATSYGENLSRTIQIMKNPCDNDVLDITNDDLSELSRWLCRKDYKLFKWVDDEDDDEIFYEVQIKLRKIELGNGRVGVELDIISNRPFGFTREITNNISLSSPITVSPGVILSYDTTRFPADNTGYVYNEKFGFDCIASDIEVQSYMTLSSNSEIVGYVRELWYVGNETIPYDVVSFVSLTSINANCVQDVAWSSTDKTTKTGSYTSYSALVGDGKVVEQIDYTSVPYMQQGYLSNINFSSIYIFEDLKSAYNYLTTGNMSGLKNNKTEQSNSKKITIFSDDEGYIYPNVTITVKKDGDLELINEFENRMTYIADCKAGEVITIIGGDTLQIVSSDDTHDMSKCFNYKFPRLCTEYMNYTNTFSANTSCDIEIKYRGIRKVGL